MGHNQAQTVRFIKIKMGGIAQVVTVDLVGHFLAGCDDGGDHLVDDVGLAVGPGGSFP